MEGRSAVIAYVHCNLTQAFSGQHGLQQALPDSELPPTPRSAPSENGVLRPRGATAPCIATECRKSEMSVFIALRELRSAWGRFTLIGVVVALVAALVGMVSGFTIGLGNDTVSALRPFDAHSVAFATGTSDFNRSTVSGHDVEVWTSRDDVAAEPLGVSMVRSEVTDSDSTTVDMLPPAWTPPVP
ncbi:hypothetical protein CVAR292_01651 [Corynebacterium variabile]|uniref:Uncharacterized protein n=2 Tax=Corynebacterium variabile TaxID=1727 RepID=A0A0X2NNL9_9CORY|nr:hypothetical protein CVAR292_01651 [Corynebacterium variabile]